MMQTERLRQALKVKGREEATLLLVDTLISDVTRANEAQNENKEGVVPKDPQQRVREVLNEYSSNKTKLLEAVHSEQPLDAPQKKEEAHAGASKK